MAAKKKTGRKKARVRRSRAELEERAREKVAADLAAEERDRHRQHILSMMSAGRWVPGVSVGALANQWDKKITYVESRAKDASQTLRTLCKMTPEFKETALAECIQTFRTIRAFALGKASQTEPIRNEKGEIVQAGRPEAQVAGLLDVALRATRALGQYTGVEPSQRAPEEDEPDRFHNWSRDELKEYIAGKNRRALPEAAGAFETIGETVDDDESVH